MTLQDRIDQIAATEREWMAQGHPVLVVSNDVPFWNARGITTAEQLDEHFAGDPHESSADRSYRLAEEFAEWLDSHDDYQPVDADLSDEEYQRQHDEALAQDAASHNPVFAETQQARVHAHFQAGW